MYHFCVAWGRTICFFIAVCVAVICLSVRSTLLMILLSKDSKKSKIYEDMARVAFIVSHRPPMQQNNIHRHEIYKMYRRWLSKNGEI
jgi:hypothetical protein